MDLFADRYLWRPDGRVLDLATAEEVFVRHRPSARAAARARWAIRCSELQSLWHPFLAELVDFGAIGPSDRFEVLRVPDPSRQWTRRDASAGWAVASAVQFLHHRGCSAGHLSWKRVVDAGGRPTLLPDGLTGTPLPGRGAGAAANQSPAAAVEQRALEGMLAGVVGSRPRAASAAGRNRSALVGGLVIQPRPAVRQIVEILEACRSGEPRSVALVGPCGSGKSRAILEIAREARLRGFVPASTVLLRATRDGAAPLDPPALANLLEHRHALIIHRADGRSRLNDGFAELIALLGTSSPRPRLFLIVGGETVDEAAVELTPLPERALIEMASVTGFARNVPDAVLRRLARQSGGLPGVFAQALLGRPAPAGWHTTSTSASPLLRAAERPGAYVVPESASIEPGHTATTTAAGAVPTSQVGWTSPGLSPPIRRACGRAEKGWALVRIGRHAAAERLLRDALGMLARRGDDARAGSVALRLGRLLLSRGRVKDALAALAAARHHFARGHAASGVIRVAVYTGLARTDAGQLCEAENALRSACLAARQLPDSGSAGLAGLALARCLLWQGRHEEAMVEVIDTGVLASEDGRAADSAGAPHAGGRREPAGAVHEGVTARRDGALLPAPETAGGAPDTDEQDASVTAACLAARIALAGGDIVNAGFRATAALERARAGGSPVDLAAAHTVLAALHAQVGDLDALRHRVQVGLRAARAAHAPLRALRLRLLLVEGLRRAGNLGEARQMASRLARARLDSLPDLLRGRVQRAIDGIPAISPAESGSHEVSWGAPLPPGAATRLGPIPPEVGRPATVDHIVEILSICHGVDDEQAALSRVVSAVRHRMRASAAAIVGLHGDQVVVLCTAGGQPPSESTARRATNGGLVISPARSPEGLEGGAPIRYAGAIIGALVCRWLPDTRVDPDQAAGVLSTAAAAVAPCARVTLDRLASPPVAATENELTGTSETVQTLRKAISRASQVPFAVLIEGESGTGKELVAQAIHRHGPRRDKRFCALNCAALADDLVEAELFGHARGAFTGAIAERAGLFEEAHGGTLLLDEISELSPRAQAKLLRVIQEGEVRRIGENFVRPIDARLVAASNRSLREEVQNGRFRQDLLYRLDVIRILVPPLRERVEDIPALAAFFWSRATARTGSRATLSPTTLAALARYDWPGNVRELQNVMAALAVTAPRRGSVGPSSLPAVIGELASTAGTSTLEDARRLFERRFVRAALARSGGHRGRAAASLGLTRQGFAKLLARLKLDVT